MAKKEPKYDPNDCATWSYDQFVQWCSNQAMTELVNEGGKGLKSGMRNILLSYRYWLVKHPDEAEFIALQAKAD